MTWREQLQPASFRGVPFHIDSVDTDFGRRNQVHEYPLRETPYAEDLGKKAREYNIRAYIIGENYLLDRDRLIKAIEDKASPGTLIHPTLGTKLVVPTRCTVSYSNREGGIEYFNLTFVEAGENRFPKESKNSKGKIFDRVKSLQTVLQDNFQRVYQGSGQIEAATTGALATATKFLGLMESSLQYVSTAKEVFSSFKTKISKISNSLTTLVYDPQEMAESFINLYETFSSAQGDAQTKLDSNLSLLSVEPLEDSPSSITVTETTAFKNDQILRYFLRGLSIGEAVKAVAEIAFPSKQEALDTRDQLRDLLEEEELSLADFGFSEIANSLSSLRAEMAEDVHLRAVFLPNISSIEINETVPAVVLAYRLHGDSAKESGLVERNNIANPLFAVGNIEFLS